MIKLPMGTANGFINPSAMSDEDWSVLRLDCEQVFTPGTPIQESDLFAGRAEQIAKLTQRIRSPGTHAIVFGERGVGKSSLVNVFKFIADRNASKIQYIRVAGVSGDTMTSLFMKVFKRIIISDVDDKLTKISDYYQGKQIAADDVLIEFQTFAQSSTPVVVIDEFDKIASC